MNVSFCQNLLINPKRENAVYKPAKTEKTAKNIDYDTLLIDNLSQRTKSSHKILTGIIAGIDIIYFTLKHGIESEKYAKSAQKIAKRKTPTKYATSALGGIIKSVKSSNTKF